MTVYFKGFCGGRQFQMEITEALGPLQTNITFFSERLKSPCVIVVLLKHKILKKECIFLRKLICLE